MKVNQQRTTETVRTNERGEITSQYYQKDTSYRIDSEPPYVKMYLDAILYLKEVKKGYNPILYCLLRYMPWASENQDFAINGAVKRQIAVQLGYTPDYVGRAITRFVKTKILFRTDVGLYRFNPNLFGRGDWKDISKLRLEIEFHCNGETTITGGFQAEPELESDFSDVIKIGGASIYDKLQSAAEIARNPASEGKLFSL